MKKILCFCMAVVLMLSASGCRFFGNDFSSLLVAPQSPGDLNQIQNALVQSISGEYTLQYPAEGAYRSAMVQYDLNGDGLREAFAFYSTVNDDGTQTMHLSFINYIGTEWAVKSDLQIVAAGIRFIEFHDLNGDGIYEVVAGWKNYNSASGILTVYCFENDNLIQRIREDYLAYLVYDADADQRQELFVVSGQRPLLTSNSSPDLAVQKAVMAASLYKLEENEIRQVGRCGLDAAPERYAKPRYAPITKDKNAVILDGYIPGGGMLTEALVWENGNLSNPFYDAVTGKNTVTYRTSTIRSLDYNKDGIVEIPQMQQLPTPAGEAAESVYLTKWMQMGESGLHSVGSAIVNTVDGYYIDVPEAWDNRITIVRKMDTKQRIVYMWDGKNFLLSDEIFRVQLFPVKEWENQEGWIELQRDETYVYAGMVNAKAGLSISIEELKNGLHLISEWNGEEQGA